MAKASTGASTPATPPATPPASPPPSSFTNNFLSGAKIEVSERSARGTLSDPVLIARHKIIQSIQAQKAAVMADIERKPFQPPGGGQRFSRWFYTSGGKYYSLIRYAQSSLVTVDDKIAGVLVGDNLADLIPWYDRLTAAIEEGQFDEALRGIQRARSQRMRGKPRANKGKRRGATAAPPEGGEPSAEPSGSTSPGKDAGGSSFLSAQSVIETRDSPVADHW